MEDIGLLFSIPEIQKAVAKDAYVTFIADKKKALMKTLGKKDSDFKDDMHSDLTVTQEELSDYALGKASKETEYKVILLLSKVQGMSKDFLSTSSAISTLKALPTRLSGVRRVKAKYKEAFGNIRINDGEQEISEVFPLLNVSSTLQDFKDSLDNIKVELKPTKKSEKEEESSNTKREFAKNYFKSNSHIKMSYLSLLLGEEIIQNKFAAHSKPLENWYENQGIGINVPKEMTSYEVNEKIRQDFVKHVLAEAAQNTYPEVTEGYEDFHEDFNKEFFNKYMELKLHLENKGKKNFFIENNYFQQNGYYFSMKSKLGQKITPSDLEQAYEAFFDLAKYGFVKTGNSYTIIEQKTADLNNRELNTFQKEMLVFLAKETGFSFSTSSPLILIPGEAITEIDAQFNKALKSYTASEDVLDKKQAYLLSSIAKNAKMIKEARFLNPIKGSNGTYAGQETVNGTTIYFDRKIRLFPEGTEYDPALKEIKVPNFIITDKSKGKLLVRIPVEGSVFAYYTTVSSVRGYFPLEKVNRDYNIHEQFNLAKPYIRGRHVNDKSRLRSPHYFEVGTDVLIYDYDDYLRLRPKKLRVSQRVVNNRVLDNGTKVGGYKYALKNIEEPTSIETEKIVESTRAPKKGNPLEVDISKNPSLQSALKLDPEMKAIKSYWSHLEVKTELDEKGNILSSVYEDTKKGGEMKRVTSSKDGVFNLLKPNPNETEFTDRAQIEADKK